MLRAVGYPDHPLVLELDPGEPIESGAGGKIANWEVETRGSRLFARPLEGARPTTVLIATRTRSYVLDLVPGSGKGMPADFVSKIVVRMPPPPAKAPEPEIEAKAAKEAATPLSEALSTARNHHYSLEAVSETIDIRPREVFDDGRFTYFRFPENLPIPAIYKSAPGSQDEWLVNSHRDGDYIVVHGVGASWNLRLSGSVLGIFNEAYDPVGIAARAGTTITGLKQELK
ncbi:TrbG/VirB9 family P-type conjugative transfer protein [Variovorax sp. KK3]|uniref:TrbG/VirB9 family P-type conjugative transfer protein n=1 Tax=Variovorax sp. KK3 TaxID=1855728 RepID=UPI0015C3D3BE